MKWDSKKQILENMAKNQAAYSTDELSAVLKEVAQCEDIPDDDEWVDTYVAPIQSGLQCRGTGLSTYVLLKNEAYGRANEELRIRVVLMWAASTVDSGYVSTGRELNLRCRYVWYDLYVYDASSEALLAKKIGIYGDSAWRFVNCGNGYGIVK